MVKSRDDLRLKLLKKDSPKNKRKWGKKKEKLVKKIAKIPPRLQERVAIYKEGQFFSTTVMGLSVIKSRPKYKLPLKIKGLAT